MQAQVEAELAATANARVESVLNDMNGAIDYIIKGADTHPNRLDMLLKAPEPARRGHWPFAKDRPDKPTYQPPNNLSAPSGSFSGQPGMSNGPSHSPWGQPAQNGFAGGFGAPQPPYGDFGQPSQPQQQVGVFGRPDQNQQGPTFGQANQPQSGFGTPQAPSPFGQPRDNSTSGFNGLTPTFGHPVVMASPLPQNTQAAQQGFGQVSQPQQPGQSFGQPSLPTANGFGGQQQQANAFVQPQQNHAPDPQNNGFGTQNNAAFSNNAQQSQQGPQQNGLTNGLTQPQAPASTSNADVSTYSTRDGSGRLLTWKGAKAKYINNNPCFQAPDGSWERIWFPEGAPAAQPWDLYAQGYPQDMTIAYEFLRQNGSFQGGIMPEMPPRHELIDWAV